MGVSRPEHAPVLRGKGEQRVCKVQRGRVEREHPILEIEPEVAGDLIVARPAGVQPLAQSRQPPGEPLFHGGVHVLLVPAQLQASAVHRRQRTSQLPTEARVLPDAEQAGGAQSLDVTQAAEHVPAQQSCIPRTVVSRGVVQQPPVEPGSRSPKRPRCHRVYQILAVIPSRARDLAREWVETRPGKIPRCARDDIRDDMMSCRDPLPSP
jgi:hypothetical protein